MQEGTHGLRLKKFAVVLPDKRWSQEAVTSEKRVKKKEKNVQNAAPCQVGDASLYDLP